MGKQQRLTEVFKKAEHIQFSDEDRIVFFSDLHRGNNTLADEFARNQIIYLYALQHYYDAGFIYVEVGDGDEILKFKDIAAIRYAHADVYHYLHKFHRAGRFYCIFGNHDIEYRDPDVIKHKFNGYTNWFMYEGNHPADQLQIHEGLIFHHNESGVDFFVVHGHQGELFSDDLFPVSRFFLRRLWRPLQLLGIQNPMSVSENIEKRQVVECQLTDWVIKNQQPMICGHTHQERMPKKHEPPYFNCGSGIHPRWITCIEIKKGKIALVRWRIKPRKKGSLFVKRDIIRGPKTIRSFSRAGEYDTDED